MVDRLRSATDIQCVSCKEWAPRPIYGEHIILDGLGGRATIPDVCDGLLTAL